MCHRRQHLDSTVLASLAQGKHRAEPCVNEAHYIDAHDARNEGLMKSEVGFRRKEAL